MPPANAITYFKARDLKLFMGLGKTLHVALAILAIFAILVFAYAAWRGMAEASGAGITGSNVSLAIPDGTVLEAEIAATEAELARGLMFRDALCERCGMLFVFRESGVHPFWMKDTLVPLDAIFLDQEYKVVDVLHMESCPKNSKVCPSYTTNANSTYVLEVNLGFAQRHNVTAGSVLARVG